MLITAYRIDDRFQCVFHFRQSADKVKKKKKKHTHISTALLNITIGKLAFCMRKDGDKRAETHVKSKYNCVTLKSIRIDFDGFCVQWNDLAVIGSRLLGAHQIQWDKNIRYQALYNCRSLPYNMSVRFPFISIANYLVIFANFYHRHLFWFLVVHQHELCLKWTTFFFFCWNKKRINKTWRKKIVNNGHNKRDMPTKKKLEPKSNQTNTKWSTQHRDKA